MLRRIEIKGYKSIENLELELKPINILIGANGAGKSNFISFFKLVNVIYEQALGQYSLQRGVDALLYYGRKNTESIHGLLDFGSNAYSFNLQPSDEDKLFIAREDSILPNQTRYKETFYSIDIKESHIKSSRTTRDAYLRDYLESFKIYHFHDTSASSALRSRADLNDNRILHEDGRNLPAFLYYLQERYPKNLNRIERLLQSVIPSFDSFKLHPLLLNEDKILLEWKDKEHPDFYFNAMHLSDGSLRFIALTTLLMQPNLPKTIIIDEPELGLHPKAINKLGAMIKSAAAKNCQIILSTQSVSLLNSFHAEDIITVEKEAGASIFRRLETEYLNTWIEDYSIGELWTKNVIKG